MTTWIYKRSEPRLWTVGYEDAKGKWQPRSDHANEAEAAGTVHMLNGGRPDIEVLRPFVEEAQRLVSHFPENETLGKWGGYFTPTQWRALAKIVLP